jgi:hypothetical protein
VSSVSRVVAEQQKQIETVTAHVQKQAAQIREVSAQFETSKFAAMLWSESPVTAWRSSWRSNRKLFGMETPTLIKSALVLELSHLKRY